MPTLRCAVLEVQDSAGRALVGCDPALREIYTKTFTGCWIRRDDALRADSPDGAFGEAQTRLPKPILARWQRVPVTGGKMRALGIHLPSEGLTSNGFTATRCPNKGPPASAGDPFVFFRDRTGRRVRTRGLEAHRVASPLSGPRRSGSASNRVLAAGRSRSQKVLHREKHRLRAITRGGRFAGHVHEAEPPVEGGTLVV